MPTKDKSASAKVENVVQFLIKGMATRRNGLAGVDIRTGRPTSIEEDIEVPTCDIWVQGAKVVPDLEDEWECEMHIRNTVQADDEDASNLDNRVAAILEFFQYPEIIKPLVNFGVVRMPEPDFMLQDIFQIGEDSSTMGRFYQETKSFLVKFRNDNGQG